MTVKLHMGWHDVVDGLPVFTDPHEPHSCPDPERCPGARREKENHSVPR